jgi:hypothetical protein
VRIAVSLSERDAKLVARDVDGYQVPKAVVRARLGDLDGALGELSGVAERNPRSANAWRTLALLLARRERVADARAALARAEAIAPQNGDTAATRARIERAEQLFHAAPPADTALARASARVHAQLVLGSPALAARALEGVVPAGPGEQVNEVALRALVDLADRDLAAARARIAEGRRRMPELSDAWAQISAQIEAMAAGPQGAGAPAAH